MQKKNGARKDGQVPKGRRGSADALGLVQLKKKKTSRRPKKKNYLGEQMAPAGEGKQRPVERDSPGGRLPSN